MKKYIIIPAVLFMLAGCENEIPYRLDDLKPELILNAMIRTGQPENYVYLNYTGKATAGDVPDGVVEIRVNGELKETISNGTSAYGYETRRRYPVTCTLEPGDVVRIDAYSTNNQHHAWAEETVPQLPLITAVDTFPTYYKDPYSYGEFKQLKYKVGIKDKPGERNYYRIELENQFEVSGKINEVKDTLITLHSNTFWPWEDIVLTDGKPASTEELDQDFIDRVKNIHGIFNNKRFAGNEYTMTVSTSYFIPAFFYYTDYSFIPERMDIKTIVRLYSITESAYYYLNVLNYIGSDVVDEYLTDPVKIPSNVNGGTGIFMISSETTHEIEILKDYQY